MKILLVGVEPDVASVLFDHAPDDATFSAVDEADALQWLGENAVDVVVTGRSLEDPVRLAQHVGKIDSNIAVVLLCQGESQRLMQRRLQFTPFLSRSVTCQSISDPVELGQNFARSIERARQRRHHQAVLQRVQRQMPALKASARTTRLYLDALLNHAPVGLVVIDPETLRVREANRKATQLLGLVEPNGRPLVEYFREEDHTRLAHLVTNGTHGAADTLTLVQDDRQRFVEITVAPVSEKEPSLGTMVILLDATERIQAERQAQRMAEEAAVARALARQAEDLRRLNRELEQRNRELQEFAFVASHDLQEPLRKISLFSDLLRMDYGDVLPPDGLFSLQRIQDAAVRMSQLIADLLTYSRVQSRGGAFSEVDLGQALADVFEDLSVVVEETLAEVEIEPLPSIEADPSQIRQLFQNLVANALKFRSPDERPRIRIRSRQGSAPARTELDGREVVHIEVEDSGIGFDPKYLDKIFSPFQRLHTSEEYPGTGMGLAICRRIVERHEGHITARSTPGEGSRFLVTLPVRQRAR